MGSDRGHGVEDIHSPALSVRRTRIGRIMQDYVAARDSHLGLPLNSVQFSF